MHAWLCVNSEPTFSFRISRCLVRVMVSSKREFMHLRSLSLSTLLKSIVLANINNHCMDLSRKDSLQSFFRMNSAILKTKPKPWEKNWIVSLISSSLCYSVKSFSWLLIYLMHYLKLKAHALLSLTCLSFVTILLYNCFKPAPQIL